MTTATPNRHQARISLTASGAFYALVVRIDPDGTETVLHGYKGRHYKTKAAADRSTAAYIAALEKTTTSDPHPGRGGANRGQGRKPIKNGEPTITISLRMTTNQRDKLEQLGGAAWVRQRIDKAKIATPEAPD